MSRLVAPVVKLTKQKIITGVIKDVLGGLCSVQMSGRGAVFHSLTYVGATPSVGDTVYVNFQGGKPIVHTNSDTLETQLTELQTAVAALQATPPATPGPAPEPVPTVDAVRRFLDMPAAPTVDDDTDAGYEPTDVWEYNGDIYICEDNAAGAAVWSLIGAGSSGSAFAVGDVSNPPTAAELIALLGEPSAQTPGYSVLLNDEGTGVPVYLVVSDGSHWLYHALTQARAGTGISLELVGTIPVPSPDIYANGVNVGELNSATDGLELVLASGGSLESPPYTGRITAFDAQGNTLWTFQSGANNGYGMLAVIGDVDDDGDNEVAATFNENSARMYLLDHTGTPVWFYSMVGGGYSRAIAIGKVRDDYPNNQVVVGGYNGQFVLLDEDGAEIWRFTLGGLTVQDAVIADTDEDGQNEIIIAYNRAVRKYNHLGTQVWSTTLGDVDNDVLGVAVGNVTADDGLEIAATVRPRAAGGSIRACYLLDKDGAEIWHWDPPGTAGCQGVLIADVNGDGQNEVVVGWGDTPDDEDPGPGNTGGVTVLDAEGNELATYDLDQISSFLAWGDANNDGQPEIVASCDDGNVYLLQPIAANITQVGHITAYEDTIANVEAAIGTLKEISFARDTTDGKLGIHIGGTWYWFSYAPTSSPSGGTLIMETGVTFPPVPLTNAEGDDWIYSSD